MNAYVPGFEGTNKFVSVAIDEIISVNVQVSLMAPLPSPPLLPAQFQPPPSNLPLPTHHIGPNFFPPSFGSFPSQPPFSKWPSPQYYPSQNLQHTNILQPPPIINPPYINNHLPATIINPQQAPPPPMIHIRTISPTAEAVGGRNKVGLLGGRFLLVTILCGVVLQWLGGAVCVVLLGKPEVIYWFIALLLPIYGIWCFVPSGLCGCFLSISLICFLDGTTILGNRILRCGIWLLCA